MLMWNPSKLTTAGKALLAKAQAGQTSIQITKAQTGSGSYSSGENIESRTALKTPKQTFPIQNKVISDADNTVILKIAITNKSESETLSTGYDITEFGIFAQDPQKGEILYSIATASTSDYMPAYNGVLPSVINMSYYLEVSNAENVTINSAGALALQADLEALEARVTTIEKNKVELLGVRRKVDASSSAWERIGDAVGMVCKAAVGNGTVQNDMMSHYPFSEMRPCNLAEDRTVNAYLGDATFQWDGTNGDVMLEVPMTYTGRWFETDADGVKWEYRAISSAQIGHLHLDHLFTDGADRRISEKVYLPIFPGSIEHIESSAQSEGVSVRSVAVDILRSRAGYMPAHNKTREQFRILCKTKGDNWYLDDVWAMHFLDTCYIVMFANTHAQGTLGPGRTEFPEDGTKGLALQERTGNYITVAKDYGNRFAIGQGISIGNGLWSQSLAADRLVTKIEDSTEVENAVCVYFDGDPVAITTTSVLWSSVQPTGATIGMASPNGRVEGKTPGMSAIRFLWIEDWYGNIWQFRDGDNIQKYQHYYCNDRSHMPIRYIMAHTSKLAM
ncbi:MAG: phage tail protein [Lachnospiraceae bacterium]